MLLLAPGEKRREHLEGDPLALVVSSNVKRRNLTKQQRVVCAAEAWDLESGTKADSRAKKLARMFEVNNVYVSQARALVERAPTAALAVREGRADLRDAYEALGGKSSHRGEKRREHLAR